MATKNFKDYAIAGSNVTLTYDDNNDTVTFASQGNVQSVNGKTGVVVINKTDVSLGNVDNTSDINKPISTLVQNALNLKEGTITAGTTAQYWRGDKTFQTLDKTAVGLSNVDNTSDANKPISTATQTALNGKQATISLTTTGNSGASTFALNVLNIPTYTLSGLGGQPLNANLTSVAALTYASTSFVKMTAAGTFALDTATYLTAESDTLESVTGRGASTTTAVTMSKLTLTGAVSGVGNLSSYTVTAATGSAISKQITSTLVASANSDVLVGLDIAPTFTNSAFTSVVNYGIRNTSKTTLGDILSVTGGSSIPSGLGNGLHFNFQSGIGWIQSLQTGVQGRQLNVMGNPILFGSSNTGIFYATLFGNGNLMLQNGGTFTDAGFRLDVNGTARIQNQLTTTGSITAASAIARGVYMNQTLVASANGDTLVGLDISPTFTNGAFTGVTNYALRFAPGNQIGVNGATSYSLYLSTNETAINAPSGSGFLSFQTNSGNRMRMFATGNLLIQNGGTFTDAGFRLDVQGTARVSNVLTLGSLASDPTGANGMIYYNTTTNRFKVYQNGAWATVTAI